jgi:hypothetical protein
LGSERPAQPDRSSGSLDGALERSVEHTKHFAVANDPRSFLDCELEAGMEPARLDFWHQEPEQRSARIAATPIGYVASAMTVLRDIARCAAHVSGTRACDPAESPV